LQLNFENIKQFLLPVDNDSIDRFFTDENELTPTPEHKDQIFMFKNEASQLLWDYEHKMLGIEANPKFYKTITTFDSKRFSISDIKKYLFNLEIPFRNWVFFAEQPDLGFMLTWKMIIKYCSGIFWDDYQQIWDKTLNWKLEYNHGIFTFGKDLIYNSDAEAEKMLLAIDEMKKRKY
jgi:hypothetical protein